MSFNVDKLLEKAYKGELLEELQIKIICLQLKEIFMKEDNLLQIKSPITLVGDIHGQFYDLLEIFKVGGEIPNTNYLFLGDYVDRGAQSVETIMLLGLLKLRHPSRIYLIRGNHENKSTTQTYGFHTECQAKYGDTQAWKSITDMFNFMPLGALIDNQILCVHGGISPSIETIDEIKSIERFTEIPREGPLTDLMWSDPESDLDGFAISPRGAGFLFGQDVFERFLKYNKITHFIRAHQLCKEGYQVLFDDKLLTVWSAPNYCFKENSASILEIDDNRSFYFNVFEENTEGRGENYQKYKNLINVNQFFV